jgi:hypothetical protein
MTGEQGFGPGLELSKVQKVTSIADERVNGPETKHPGKVYFVSREPNAFGLPAVETCPGSNDYCELDCYAIDSEYRDDTLALVQRNLARLQEEPTVEAMTTKLSAMLEGYREQAAALGIADDKRRFRIHWDGDFFSTDYAEAWRNVIETNADINFWVYTRSFQEDVNVLPVLAGLENLDLFISVDRRNVDRAAEVLPDFPGVKVGYLVDYQNEADRLIATLGRADFRHRACPENMREEDGSRKLKLVTGDRGGACIRCTYCINKPDTWDVVFVKKGLEEQPPQEVFSFGESIPFKQRKRNKQIRNVSRPVGEASVTRAVVEMVPDPVLFD